MRRVLATATLSLLAACGGPAPAPVSSANGMAMEFRGERPCADCAGIRASLRLQQAGEQRRYRLVEVYLGDAGARRFEDAGEWRADGDLLRLVSGDGGERVYLRMGDGRLQARGSDGEALPALADEVLLPVGMGATR